MRNLPILVALAGASLLTVAATKPARPAVKPPVKLPAKVANRAVTYAADVAPILNRSCVSCHQPGQVAPFSLIGYDNARKWSGMAAGVVASRQMPPWKAVSGFGEFQGENRLTDGEIATLKRWHDEGMPRGDRKKEPKPVLAASGEWALGRPDMIVTPSKPYRLDPEGTDVYRNYVIHPNVSRTVWVTGLDVKPGNRKIVHHVIVFLDSAHASTRLAAASNDGQEGYTTSGGGVGFLPSGSFGGWAPGIQPRRLAPGTGFRLDPGTDIVLQVHYHKDGKPETDLTKVGLYLTRQPVAKEMHLQWLLNLGVNIPPGEKNYHLSRTYTLPRDLTVYGAMPHMHLLGRSMKAWFVLPDGTVKPLVYVDNWDFNWQLFYTLKQPLHLPKGTKEIVEATYDNSAGNPRNPNDPPKRVTWGEQTTDEMFLLIAAYTDDEAGSVATK